MKIQLLGTGAADGWPALFCPCEACREARKLGGKNLRTRSTALIDGVLKIDLPPDTLTHVIQHNLDLTRLHALLFTHIHDDHFAPAELQYLGAHFVFPPRTRRFPVYGPADVIAALAHRFADKPDLLELYTLTAWETARVAGYRVTPILAQHNPEVICFNYIIQDSAGTTLLYASDTGWYEEATWNYLEKIPLDAIVVECAKGPVESGYSGHMSIPQVVALRQRLIAAGVFHPESPIVTTHFSHLGGLMHHELETVFAPHNILPGHDGMTFSVAKSPHLNA